MAWAIKMGLLTELVWTSCNTHCPRVKPAYLVKIGSVLCKHHVSIVRGMNIQCCGNRQFLITWMKRLGKYVDGLLLERHAYVLWVMQASSSLYAYRSIFSSYSVLPQCLSFTWVMHYHHTTYFTLTRHLCISSQCFHTSPIQHVSVTLMSSMHIILDMFKILITHTKAEKLYHVTSWLDAILAGAMHVLAACIMHR